ncbi:uncharacterized protein B0H18DRAFT_846756, partial [Fomitopsis serialis]|uniref:uncharacterized protein n=1 Tax=Fomitopsis serialis TaxID=139415 RepID=UPI002007B968
MSEDTKWKDEDTRALLHHLIDRKAEAGDGVNFPNRIWSDAVQKVQAVTTGGGAKTAKSCKGKWKRLRDTYKLVEKLMSQSGFHWDPKTGASIDAKSESVWQTFCKVSHKNKGAQRFRNKGWDFYDLMKELMPVKVKGTH